MKNLLKMSLLSSCIAMAVTACDPPKTTTEGIDTVKVDSTKKDTPTVKIETLKKDTVKK